MVFMCFMSVVGLNKILSRDVAAYKCNYGVLAARGASRSGILENSRGFIPARPLTPNPGNDETGKISSQLTRLEQKAQIRASPLSESSVRE